jgi:hypothetical protein
VHIRPGVAVGLLLGFLVQHGALGQTAAPATPAAAAPGLDERLTALKQMLAQNRKALRTYTWVETLAVSYKGELKSTTKNSCSVGPDGTVQKVQLSVDPPPESKGGGFAERKRQELRNTVKAAVTLVKSYVPLDPALIQKCKDAGKASMTVLASGKLVRLVFKDYRLPGDHLTLTLDGATNRLDLITVASYLDSSTPITLDVHMAALQEGTAYVETMQLSIPSKDLAVAVSNGDYKPKS